MTRGRRIEVHEHVASQLFNRQLDVTSQGPLNEIRPRTANRIGGTIGVEDTLSLRTRSDLRALAPVEDSEGVEFMRAVADVYRREIDGNQQDVSLVSGASRLTLRTLVRVDMIEELRESLAQSRGQGNRHYGVAIEAQMVADPEYAIVYMGLNGPNRRLPEGEYHAVEGDARRKSSSGAREGPFGVEDIRRANERSGIGFTVYDNKNNRVQGRDYEAIAGLLRTFGYDTQDAVRSVTSPSNTVVLAVEQGRGVIGMALIEHHPILLSNGRVLHTAELTDFVVNVASRRNNVSYTMTDMLLHDLFTGNIENEMYVVFAEANTANHITTTFARFGGTYSGLLPNHIELASGGDDAEMRSFAVMQFMAPNVPIV
ncbi:MAG: hypothetical protein KGH72_04105 [Candidatus Micrarchaeota archaeon]|nr:hypothetical protein [Candidatus Micrarchaeota archaeon]